MKNLILGLILALSASAAFAVDFSGDVSADSRYIYRGFDINNDDPTVGVSGKVDNVLVPGLYASGQLNSLSTTPVTSISTRADVGAGYHTGLGVEGLDVDVSLHRVFNPSVYATPLVPNYSNNLYQNSYNELRGRVSYEFSPVTVYGEVGQIVSTGFSRDTYFAGGVEGSVLTPSLTVGALVAGNHYRDEGVTRYNNSEVYASYKVWKNLNVEGRYSFGGKTVNDLDLSNQGYVGVRYTF